MDCSFTASPAQLAPRRTIDVLQDQLLRNPRNASALGELGLYAFQADDLDRALDYMREAVGIDERAGNWRAELGRILVAKGSIEEARIWFEEWVNLRPDSPLAYMSLGEFYITWLAFYNEAEGLFLKALQLNPALDKAYWRYCSCLIQGGTLDETLVRLRHSIGLNLMDPFRAYLGLQCALAEYGRYFEARACNQELLRLYPNATIALGNIGLISLGLRDADQAIACTEEAMRREPEDPCHIHRHLRVLLAQGLYQRAREHSEIYRRFLPMWRFPNNETWTGEPLAGKTIVFNVAHAGFGDAIQNVRLADILKREGATVIARCRTPLLRIFRTIPFVDSVVPSEYSSPKADYEALPDHVAWNRHIDEDWMGSTVPYLHPTAHVQAFWTTRMLRERGLKVGIRWRGGDVEMRDIYQRRSVPIEALQPLLEIDGISLFSVQKGPGAEELDSFPGACSITRLGHELDDFIDLAGAISALDLLVSVDTSVAHLSGAMGKPTWILLPYAQTDWRWHISGDRSEWYPSVRLFRQHEPGEWEDVVSNVVAALRTWVSEYPATGAGVAAR
jgi:tetratricopeptide (TPR) repeat protein